MRNVLSAFALAAFASTAAAQGDGWSHLFANGPGVTDEEPGRSIVIAAGRTPGVTAHQNFNSWAQPYQGMWDWRINITNISVPNDVRQLGEPSANNSQGLSLINTQWQLDWPGVADGNNQTLQEYLKHAYGNTSVLYAQASTFALSPDVYTQFKNKASGRDFNCSTIFNSTCLDDLRIAVAGHHSFVLGDIKSCQDTNQYLTNDTKTNPELGFQINASGANDNETKFLNFPNTTFYAVTSPTTSGGNYTYYNRAITALNILALALEFPISGGGLTVADIQCQIVGIETGYATSAGVRLPAATGLAMVVFLGVLAALNI